MLLHLATCLNWVSSKFVMRNRRDFEQCFLVLHALYCWFHSESWSGIGGFVNWFVLWFRFQVCDVALILWNENFGYVHTTVMSSFSYDLSRLVKWSVVRCRLQLDSHFGSGCICI